MKKVLIVDDSSYMRMFIKKIINKSGSYVIYEASSKEEAVEIYKSEKPDIVILDLNMSEDRMDGIHVLTDIKGIEHEALIIVTSAVGYEDVKDKCIELGAKLYIRKPIDAKALVKAIEEN